MALKTGDLSIALPLRSIALRKAKIVCNFGLSECNRIKTGLIIPSHNKVVEGI